MAAGPDADEVLALLQRRWRLILGMTLAVALAAVLAGAMRPPVYEAAALIQVEGPAGAAPAPGQPVSDAARRAAFLQAIEARLTTREALSDMADRHGLFAATPGLSSAAKAEALRRHIRVTDTIGAAQGGEMAARRLRIAARATDPALAARLANDLAQGFVDEAQARQSRSTRATQAFFAAEEARLWQALVAAEDQLARFRAENADALPEEAATRRASLIALDAEQRAQDQTWLALSGERDRLAADAATPPEALAALEDRLAQVDRQRQAVTAQRAAITAALARLPAVEARLRSFARSLQLLQDQYSTVNARLAEATAAQRMTEQNQGEHLTMLERAVTPQAPAGPPGWSYLLAGALLGLGLGLAAALWAEWRRPVIRTARQMDRELGLMPVVSIPDLALAEPPRPGPALRLPAASHSARLALRLRQSPWTLPSLAVLVALVSSLI